MGWGYGFQNGGESNGRGGDGDGDGDGDGEGATVIVIIEYNESGLEIWIMNHSTWLPKPPSPLTFPSLGVEATPSSSADDTSTYLLTVQRRLEARLREFLVREEDGDGAVVGGWC